MLDTDALPITVLTGFLGSGKTTLLRAALAAPAMADTAVIVNELGEIGIDHHLLEFVDDNILELPGGCLCCAVREDLARTLRDLLARRDLGRLRPFRRIVVETTGLADPGPILYTFGADPELDARLRLARVVTTVDAVCGAATLDRFAEAARQAAVADALVVTKTDLAPLSPDLERRLAALNPTAERVIAAERGRAAADVASLLFGPAARLALPPAGAAPTAAHTHGIDAFAVLLEQAGTRLDFARALGGLARARGNELLRVKGIVEFADRPGKPAVVQAAQHTMFAPEWLEAWPAELADGDRRGRLVFIVHGIPRAEVLTHFAFARPRLWPGAAAGAEPGFVAAE